MSPRLSVVVPAYNAENTIQKCLRSIVSCYSNNIEIVVVNDGSKDETAAACIALGDSRVRVFSQPNAGVSIARNTGIDLSDGDYIMFVDDDDTLNHGWFNVVAEHMNDDEDVVIFASDSTKKRYTIDELVASVVGTWPQQSDEVRRPPLRWASSPWSRIYSHRFLERAGVSFAPNIINGEDALFNLKVFLATERIRFIKDSIYRYRTNDKSATHTFDHRFFASNEAYLVKLSDLLASSGGYSESEIKALIDFSFCNSVRLMALRAAREKSMSDSLRAASTVEEDSLVCERILTGVDISRNDYLTRTIYSFLRANKFAIAVLLLRTALAFTSIKTSDNRWVSI